MVLTLNIFLVVYSFSLPLANTLCYGSLDTLVREEEKSSFVAKMRLKAGVSDAGCRLVG